MTSGSAFSSPSSPIPALQPRGHRMAPARHVAHSQHLQHCQHRVAIQGLFKYANPGRKDNVNCLFLLLPFPSCSPQGHQLLTFGGDGTFLAALGIVTAWAELCRHGAGCWRCGTCSCGAWQLYGCVSTLLAWEERHGSDICLGLGRGGVLGGFCGVV